MAKIIYEVYQNQNEHNSAYGKWYGRVKYLESMNTRKLSNHIAEHGSIYTPDVAHRRARKYLHPRRRVRRDGEVPQLSVGDAAQLEEGEDRGIGNLLHYSGVREGWRRDQGQVQHSEGREGSAHPFPA